MTIILTCYRFIVGTLTDRQTDWETVMPQPTRHILYRPSMSPTPSYSTGQNSKAQLNAHSPILDMTPLCTQASPIQRPASPANNTSIPRPPTPGTRHREAAVLARPG
ncbi:hypothetical protein FALCPG4_012051 [Fusarium falciforme]